MKKKVPSGFIQDPKLLFEKDQKNFLFLAKNFLHRYFIQVGVCALIVLLHLVIVRTPTYERLEMTYLDFLFKLRPPLETHESIAYIEIAEDSLQALGRWPWPRHYHAAVAHFLTKWGAKSIIFDILFSERGDEFDDGALAEAIEASNDVYVPARAARLRSTTRPAVRSAETGHTSAA